MPSFGRWDLGEKHDRQNVSKNRNVNVQVEKEVHAVSNGSEKMGDVINNKVMGKMGYSTQYYDSQELCDETSKNGSDYLVNGQESK